MSLPLVEIVLCAMRSQVSGVCSGLQQVFNLVQSGAVKTGERWLTETRCSAQGLHIVRSSGSAWGYRGLKNPVLSNFLGKA